MKLSDSEKKTVATPRKGQQFRGRWRIPLLIFHVLCSVALLVMLVVVCRFPDSDSTAKLIVVSYLLPPIYIFLALQGLCIGFTIKNWNGDPQTELLLKVVDELQKRDG